MVLVVNQQISKSINQYGTQGTAAVARHSSWPHSIHFDGCQKTQGNGLTGSPPAKLHSSRGSGARGGHAFEETKGANAEYQNGALSNAQAASFSANAVLRCRDDNPSR